MPFRHRGTCGAVQGAHSNTPVQPGDGPEHGREPCDVVGEGPDAGGELLGGAEGGVGPDLVEQFVGCGLEDRLPENAL